MATVRLFHQDSYRRSFRARVLCRVEEAGRPAVVLDRTCFYPNAGGQPSDRGEIGGVQVLDVFEREGDIVHVLDAPLAGQLVVGRIDWPRRFDHMQQHSGQHILSQAFLQVLGAQTLSFHLGEAVSTIEVDLPTLSQSDAERVEDLANDVVFHNRPVRSVAVPEEGVAELDLRKRPSKTGEIRVVVVGDFDRSPCGGTHVRGTGEVGGIKIRKLERRTRGVRVEFLAGWRALRDYRWKNRLVNEVSATLSIKDAELDESLSRLIADERAARREVTHLREKLLDYEALELLAIAALVGPWRVVHHAFPARDVNQVRWLAQRLTSHSATVALLAVAAEKGNLVYARAPDVSLDMGDLLRRACQLVGGRGGGKPDLAQGGAPDCAAIRRALEWSLAEIGRLATDSRG